MLVKVNTSLAGADFSYSFGAEVDSEEFSAKVGNGWQNLCEPLVTSDPVEEATPEPESAKVEVEFETADLPQVAETANAAPPRRGRRK